MKKNLDIIIIEDSEEDAQLAIRSLKKEKIATNILWLKDGVEALDFFFGDKKKNQKEENFTNPLPRIVLLDLKMPRLDGREFLKIFRQDQKTKKLPIVVLSSSREFKDIEQCYLLGANSYIVKPVEFDKFSSTIKSIGRYWLSINQTI